MSENLRQPPPVPRYQPEHSGRAEVRPGPTAPRPDHGDSLPEAGERYAAIRQARQLWAVANPHQFFRDAMFTHLRPELLRVEAELWRELSDNPDDGALGLLHREVLQYVPWMRSKRGLA